MTIAEFQKLNEAKQLEVSLKGRLIGESKDQYGYITECRKMGKFYVEYLQRKGKFVSIRSFD